MKSSNSHNCVDRNVENTQPQKRNFFAAKRWRIWQIPTWNISSGQSSIWSSHYVVLCKKCDRTEIVFVFQSLNTHTHTLFSFSHLLFCGTAHLDKTFEKRKHAAFVFKQATDRKETFTSWNVSRFCTSLDILDYSFLFFLFFRQQENMTLTCMCLFFGIANWA